MMQIPDFVHTVLNSFENQTAPFNEAQVYDALIAARKTLGDLSNEDFEGFGLKLQPFFFCERGIAIACGEPTLLQPSQEQPPTVVR